MNTETDECGSWEKTNGTGCTNQMIVDPTDEYYKKYPEIN